MANRIGRIIFIGTPEFAIPSILSLINNKRPVLIITRPDRKKGRGQKLSCTPVKEIAMQYNIPVFQPENINSEHSLDRIKDANPDLIVTVAFGSFLKNRLLSIPRYGCISLHPSLLPKYRGPSPINWAIFNGEKETGNTIFFINRRMDAGDIIFQRSIEITNEDNFGTLSEKLSKQGAKDLLYAISLIEEDNYQPIPQQEEEATFSHLITEQVRAIKWENSAERIYNQIRGLAPKPCAFAKIRKEKIKIISAEIGNPDTYGTAGEIARIVKHKGIEVYCGVGSIIITKLQPTGKRVMSAIEFNNGAHLKIGEFFD
ncbi:MAG: methionyl-tRNA formyltransferase [Candidatus Cloacimonadota bacterium]|nr:MAG: methionyl-tRNA formyltransferase [Candidatus Cloacimonadota bacterium]